MVESEEKLNVLKQAESKARQDSGSNSMPTSSERQSASTTERASARPAPLSPMVYWAQTEDKITLRVDLKDVVNPNVDFTPKSLIFSSKGYGARGCNIYKFDLSFFGFINDEECRYKVHDYQIDMTLKKAEKSWWPRLVATPQKPHWLKIDFDRWRTEEDALDEEEKPRDVRVDYAKEYDRLQKEEYGYIKESYKKVYLVLYNLAQFCGYLYIFCVMSLLYYRDGEKYIPKAYESVGNAMKFCQLLQYLEVLHPVFGYTKGGPVAPFFQVSGRNFVLFIMIEMEERMQTKPVVFYVFFVWALIEIIRYPFYLSQILKYEIGLLTWLRYTLWIPLYPMGIICEGIIILRNIPYFEETQRLSIHMPNKLNFTFDMPSILKMYLILLIMPGSYMAMSHMSSMRAKKLGSKKRQRKYSD